MDSICVIKHHLAYRLADSSRHHVLIVVVVVMATDACWSAAVPGERDVLIMRHDVGVEWPNHNDEMIHVNFVIYGDPNKYSAMAATVGYPTAIATKMVLEGTLHVGDMLVVR